MYLILMFGAVVVLILFNKLNIRNFIPYLIVGILLWEFTHASGIHATIAGVLLALTIPHKDNNKSHSKSMLLKIEHAISPYVAYGIMPIFAFANAGVSLSGLGIETIFNKVPLGIVWWFIFWKTSWSFYFFLYSNKIKICRNANKIKLGNFLCCWNFNWYRIYNEVYLLAI